MAMSEPTENSASVSATVVIAQRPKPGREDDYRRWQTEIDDASRTFPGFEGVEVIPPVPGIQDAYVVIFRFDSFAHLDAWLSSDTRQGAARASAGPLRRRAPPVRRG
jgi:antibiotic biosynthesis monooxygenase (ABM) superfamily enzyme